MLADMKHGETRTLEAHGKQYGVSYHSDPAKGDNGQLVRGASVGTFTVDYPDGSYTFHRHGPHANTEAAAKRGANRSAKPYAARLAMEAIGAHAAKAAIFNDRR